MNMLYDSGKFELLTVDVTGKKATASRFYFRGKPSVYGGRKKVLSLFNGEVVFAGREMLANTRQNSYKLHVTVRRSDGVCATYAFLDSRLVKVGDRVVKGQPIGIEGARNGMGSVLLVEFRKNDRRIDGYEVLCLLTRGAQEFDFTSDVDPAEVACKVCGIDKSMRSYIDAHPSSAAFWDRLVRHLAVAE